MLVKLGSDWYDPSLISNIWIEESSPTLIHVRMNNGFTVSQNISELNSIDGLASAVNEALTPKQSWSEEISEPANT